MSRLPLSVTIVACNEERNLARALNSVSWAEERLVIDSGSTDRTREIAAECGAKVIDQSWLGYGKQKNFAQSHAQNDWILNLDADEEISGELAQEIQALLSGPCKNPENPYHYLIPRKSRYLGRWILHGGWYPDRKARLGNRHHSQWTEPAVHEALVSNRSPGQLKSPILHYPFSGIRDQILTNLRYSRLGYEQRIQQGQTGGLALLLLKSISKFLETYILKRGFLDGIPGLIISVNAAHSVFMKFSYYFEEKK
jgi:glycosyltransferase involved in cell wall biosynthesis